MIHPSAVVHPGVKLDSSIEVGPFSVIDEGVELGPHCVLGPRVYLTGRTIIGASNRFFAGSVIGEAPQDFKYRGQPTRLTIGDQNVFRENVTIHRSASEEGKTTIGSRNFLMAGSHVAHDCRLGDDVVIVNGALLAGHVSVADKALVSGNAVVHQFCRIGTLAMLQGGAVLTQDLAPYTVAYGGNRLCGLNLVGLRRAGVTSEARMELKRLYRALFSGGKSPRIAAEAAMDDGDFQGPASQKLIEFILATKRGICQALGNRSRGRRDSQTSLEVEALA